MRFGVEQLIMNLAILLGAVELAEGQQGQKKQSHFH